ncbi:MAG: rhodanese-like domain-containing protein [Deltaproteobacteria bacterium]|nr:MAG: rhodanese-like domain-containing protein [Deltaproteobacteria bacterium]
MNASQAAAESHESVLVDVREPAEFRELHLDAAVNLPSTRSRVADYEPYRDRTIRLICNSGRRARIVKAELDAAAFPRVEVCAVQMQAYGETGRIGIEGAWTLDRQFRLALGVLLLISLLGTYLVSPWFISIACVVATALTVTSLLDRCYFKVLIANMPWNRCPKPEASASEASGSATVSS